ncbi:hypothetical protein [Frigoribacterium sp. SL97]|uniref:hypothetical protein n=1 Tax=Frigoribacterium sp. SL97 TaxID=2994664 RepID=UPI00226DFEDC|nr:hypothetical protein [Frigoribacterium sp. SL97]WAC53238.1 hypothetical protein OVA02_08425 [Frigoribacterium sp. SL97]
MRTMPNSYILPTDDGQAVEISRTDYDALLGDGGLTQRRMSTITAAARILSVFVDDEPRKFQQIVEGIYGSPEALGTSALRRGITALVDAGLLEQIGRTSTARYRLPVTD